MNEAVTENTQPAETEEVITPEDFLVSSGEEPAETGTTEGSEQAKPAEPTVQDQEQAQEQAKEQKVERPDFLDPRFRSIEEQAKAYREAEKRMFKATQEAAEYRKLIDTYLLNSLQQSQAPKPKPKENVFTKELGLDEEKVKEDIFSTIAPAIAPIAKKLSEIEQQFAMSKKMEQDIAYVTSINPDHFEIVNSDDFVQWAKGNLTETQINKGMADPDMAATIVTMYKKFRQLQQPANQSANQTVNQQIQTPQIPTPQHTESAKAPTKAKIWSRAELIKMQHENPEKYASLQGEIMRAYREGRVK